MKKPSYQIKKIMVNSGKPQHVILLDSTGVVFETNKFEQATKLCEILNTNSDIVNYGSIFPNITYLNFDNNWAEHFHDTGNFVTDKRIKDKYNKYL